jgi:hypothetical protein
MPSGNRVRKQLNRAANKLSNFRKFVFAENELSKKYCFALMQ